MAYYVAVLLEDNIAKEDSLARDRVEKCARCCDHVEIRANATRTRVPHAAKRSICAGWDRDLLEYRRIFPQARVDRTGIEMIGPKIENCSMMRECKKNDDGARRGERDGRDDY